MDEVREASAKQRRTTPSHLSGELFRTCQPSGSSLITGLKTHPSSLCGHVFRCDYWISNIAFPPPIVKWISPKQYSLITSQSVSNCLVKKRSEQSWFPWRWKCFCARLEDIKCILQSFHSIFSLPSPGISFLISFQAPKNKTARWGFG